VAAVVAGSFSLWQAGLWLVAGAVGGVAIGLAVGWLIAEALRWSASSSTRSSAS
jgi:NhaP-type Na+/H+ or K+/H+ antiporter